MKEKIEKNLLAAQPFQYLEAHELKMLMTYSPIVSFAPGQMILQQGKPNIGMYVLIKGHVLVTAKTLGKGTLKIVSLGPGAFIGEVSLIEKGPCVASVVASTKVQCLVITRTYFEMLGTFFPEVRYKINTAIIRVVCDRLKNIYNEINKIISKNLITPTKFNLAEIKNYFVKPGSTNFLAAEIDPKLIKEFPAFELLSSPEYEELLKYSSLVNVPDKYTLIHLNAEQSPCYIVLRGAVQLRITEKLAKLAVLPPVSVFTSIYYVNETPSFIAYTSCEKAILLKFELMDLERLKQDNINLWYKINYIINKSFVSLERFADRLYVRLTNEVYIA